MGFQLPFPQLVSLLTGFLMNGETKQHQFWSWSWPSTSPGSPFRGAFPPASFTVTQPSRGPIPCCKRYPEPAAEPVTDAGCKSFGFFFLAQGTALGIFIQPRKNQRSWNLKNIPQKDIWRKISSLVVFSVTLQGRFLQSKLLDLT